jgi:hypothetical protein
MSRKYAKQPCSKSGCKNWAMLNGAGFCFAHNPDQLEKRQAISLNHANSLRQNRHRSVKHCAYEGCWGWHIRESIYCAAHYQKLIDLTRAKGLCNYPGCRAFPRRDGSGFCFNHNPALTQEQHQARLKQALFILSTPRPPEKQCAHAGCRGWPMLDGSGFCAQHNPAKSPAWLEAHHKQAALMSLVVRPLQRACKVKGCHNWTQDDGSGLCWSHKPENIIRQSERMKGKKINLGRHLPYLGLENIEEARGLIFYSLENNKPLLTLRALTKIASLHSRGEMGMGGKRRTENVEPKA